MENIFIEDLNEEINKRIEYFINLKNECVKVQDFKGSANYTAVLYGMKEVLELYCQNNLIQLIYNDLITLETDDLIINYPII
jgi:hypothetical protein